MYDVFESKIPSMSSGGFRRQSIRKPTIAKCCNHIARACCSLLKKGYKAQLRPSGHDISDKFQRDNNGAIPPNLLRSTEPDNILELANTESNSSYFRRCKAAGIKPHPARFPQSFASFFINLLTDEGDMVIDPFAGSNTTGYVAEQFWRRWIAFELQEDYLKGSRLRFEGPTTPPEDKHVEEGDTALVNETLWTLEASNG